MQIQKTAGYGQEIEKIISAAYPAGNYNAIDNAASDLVMMTLLAFQKGTHPVINQRNFITDPLPVPNMTVFDQKNGHYTGVRFPANCSMALDLFSINKNISSRGFIAMDELKRMKLDGFIRHDEQISIVLKSRWTKADASAHAVSGGITSLRVVNIESLLKSPNNPRGHLSAPDFNMYFPDFEKQTANYLSFSQKCAKLLQENTGNSALYGSVKKQMAMDTKNSRLPKLTAEMAHFEFCRLTRREYTPQFSREEHLKDMVKLYKQNPQLLKDAIKQSGHIVDRSMNRLFGSDTLVKVQSVARSQQEQRSRVNVRKHG